MFRKIVDFVLKYTVFHDSQHGFKEGQSTQNAVISFLNNLFDNLKFYGFRQ